jgi:hypothetical protein
MNCLISLSKSVPHNYYLVPPFHIRSSKLCRNSTSMGNSAPICIWNRPSPRAQARPTRRPLSGKGPPKAPLTQFDPNSLPGPQPSCPLLKTLTWVSQQYQNRYHTNTTRASYRHQSKSKLLLQGAQTCGKTHQGSHPSITTVPDGYHKSIT